MKLRSASTVYLQDFAAERLLLLASPEVTRPLVRELTRHGHSSTVTVSAAAAESHLDAQDVGLALVDLDLGEAASELLATLERGFPGVAILALASPELRDRAVEALHGGTAGYVLKPASESEISLQVARILGSRRRESALGRCRERRRALERELDEHHRRRRQREHDMASRLASALEYRDGETAAHVERIGRYAAELGRELGWTSSRLEDLELAAAMHDIGKIGVPEHILLKPDRLTPKEYEVVKTHTQIGATILGGSRVPHLRMARQVALYHHERWDGGGYPRGLAREAIPASARIVAVADVYDALVHQRVYRPAVPEAETLAYMRTERGRHFDPQVFDCFMDLLPRLRHIRRELADQVPVPALPAARA